MEDTSHLNVCAFLSYDPYPLGMHHLPLFLLLPFFFWFSLSPHAIFLSHVSNSKLYNPTMAARDRGQRIRLACILVLSIYIRAYMKKKCFKTLIFHLWLQISQARVSSSSQSLACYKRSSQARSKPYNHWSLVRLKLDTFVI